MQVECPSYIQYLFLLQSLGIWVHTNNQISHRRRRLTDDRRVHVLIDTRRPRGMVRPVLLFPTIRVPQGHCPARHVNGLNVAGARSFDGTQWPVTHSPPSLKHTRSRDVAVDCVLSRWRNWRNSGLCLMKVCANESRPGAHPRRVTLPYHPQGSLVPHACNHQDTV
jgi:hypothetical protein